MLPKMRVSRRKPARAATLPPGARESHSYLRGGVLEVDQALEHLLRHVAPREALPSIYAQVIGDIDAGTEACSPY